jgi:hypothetical protein
MKMSLIRVKIKKRHCMKKLIINYVVASASLIIAQIAQAQGTMYFSSLSPNTTGNIPIGSDSWPAAGFITGINAEGYLLDSIQLAVINATGNPNGFTVMLYDSISDSSVHPGSSLCTLSGSANPSTADIYTYTPAADLFLPPSTSYFIVLTASTTIANGTYEWSQSSFPPSSSGGWGAAINGVLSSSNGASDWSFTPYSGIAQFAITASAIPEPSPSWFLLFGSGVLFYVRRRRQPTG